VKLKRKRTLRSPNRCDRMATTPLKQPALCPAAKEASGKFQRRRENLPP